MDGIFINYRREDSAPYAGRLHDFLSRAFPKNKVFIDIDNIDPGQDFVDAIDATLIASRIVIAVIGPNWTKVADGEGNRRLDNPDDYVVRELSAALKSSAVVIPVLVGRAEMPSTNKLPDGLQPLARRNAIEISDTRFVADAERLSAAISRVIHPAEGRNSRTQRLLIEEPPASRPTPREDTAVVSTTPDPGKRKVAWVPIALIAIIVVGLIAGYGMYQSAQEEAQRARAELDSQAERERVAREAAEAHARELKATREKEEQERLAREKEEQERLAREKEERERPAQPVAKRESLELIRKVRPEVQEAKREAASR